MATEEQKRQDEENEYLLLQEQLDKLEQEVMEKAYSVAYKRKEYPALIMKLFEESKLQKLKEIERKEKIAREKGDSEAVKKAIVEKAQHAADFAKERAEAEQRLAELKQMAANSDAYNEVLKKSLLNPATMPTPPEARFLSKLTAEDLPFLAE